MKKRAAFAAGEQPPIVMMKTAALKPHPKNARTHPERQLKALESSIRRFGIRQPLQHWRGLIIAGCGRLAVAQRIELEEVPCRDLSSMTENQAREYMLHDNALAEQARWDEELKAMEVVDLTAAGADFGGVIAQSELDRFLRPEFQDQDETLPALSEHVISRGGDVWVMEGHRLICGDATDPATVAAVLKDARPHLMVTDPPYGVAYDPNWRNEAARNTPGMGNRKLGAGAVGIVQNDNRADWADAWRLFPGSVAYVWHGGLHGATVAQSLIACGFQIRAQIVWVKSNIAISRGAYHWQHEPAFYAVQPGADDHWRFEEEHEGAAFAVKDGQNAQWRGGRRQTTVWPIDMVRNDTGHGTQKPMECMRRPILNNSQKGDAIYEPFSGSGTTLAAAEQTGRRCFAIELDARYVDVAVKRWQLMTGAVAKRESDGAAFNDLEPSNGKGPKPKAARVARVGGKPRKATVARGGKGRGASGGRRAAGLS